LSYAASTAKGVAASLAHVLAERGDLDYDMTLASVWPEFGCRGKDRVPVRQVLLHTAGLPGLPAVTTPEDLCDWEHMCTVLAGEQPWWEPGTRFGYHVLTFGFLLGEVIRRVTGQSVAELLRELVTGPLGVADEVCFGVPPALLPGAARQVPGDSPAPAPEPGSALDLGVRLQPGPPWRGTLAPWLGVRDDRIERLGRLRRRGLRCRGGGDGNRFTSGDLSAVTRIDRIVAEMLPGKTE
jgi:CubicO group peptidase (beta-lactamase class C family)